MFSNPKILYSELVHSFSENTSLLFTIRVLPRKNLVFGTSLTFCLSCIFEEKLWVAAIKTLFYKTSFLVLYESVENLNTYAYQKIIKIVGLWSVPWLQAKISLKFSCFVTQWNKVPQTTLLILCPHQGVYWIFFIFFNRALPTF